MDPFGSRPGGLPGVGPRFSRSVGNPAGTHQTAPMLFSQPQPSAGTLPLNYSLPEQHWRLDTHPTGTQSRGKRLRVEDALSYLEQVKQQFAQAPEVYGDFLDIMKEFKSQTIDTPGVICRVSRLFRGRPNLIIGFNTFLPPGFEVRLDGPKIIISEPSGQTRCIDDGSPEHPTTSSADARPERLLPPSNGAGSVEMLMRRADEQDTAPHFEPSGSARASSEVPVPVQPAGDSPAVGLDNAMQYVQKIKLRFQDRPEIYQKFLTILQAYQNSQKQRHQRHKDEGHSLTENQVYSSVALLFENEPDLLSEFSNFLPDVNCLPSSEQQQSETKQPRSAERALLVSPLVDVARTMASDAQSVGSATSQLGGTQKRAASHVSSQGPAPKKNRTEETKVLVYETDINEAVKHASVEDFMFFDKVRRLFTDDEVYETFLRCLALYNQSIVSRNELLDLVNPFLGRRPDLMKYMKEMLGMNEAAPSSHPAEEAPPKAVDNHDKVPSGPAHQIDFATCKRLGISYRSLPDSYPRPVCSGRTTLCESVLNDTWVSFPSWSSEDTSCVHSKKTQYEEFIYKTEDERFELDIIIEINKAALENLVYLERKMSRMKKEELNRFRLDASLGYSSPSLMYRALKRIYGENANKMLEGAQKNPAMVIPRLIERLRTKDTEWREAQTGFNRVWRDQTDKYFAKSLDHQALTFKQNDLKLLRSKMIIHHFETLYDERETRLEEGGPSEYGPHCILDYPSSDSSVFYDVNDLIIHYVKRQPNIQKDEKKQAKRFLKRVIPEFFNLPPQSMSDDEDTDEPECSGDGEGNEKQNGSAVRVGVKNESTTVASGEEKAGKSSKIDLSRPERAAPSTYRLFYGANTWCIFLRLHQMLCDRFSRLKTKNMNMITDFKIEEHMRALAKKGRPGEKETDRGLHLLKKSAQNPEHFYQDLICAVKNLLDGQIEASAFEDTVRNMFGTDAYVSFTMDKIITTLGRQLQAMFTEELNVGTLELYQKYRFEKPMSSVVKTKNEEEIEEAYEAAAQKLLANQNCFKTFFLHDRKKVTVELIDSETIDEGNEDAEDADKKWSQYINYYLKSTADEPSTSTVSAEEQQQLLEDLAANRIFLMRNVKAGIERSKKKEEDVKRRGKWRGKGKNEKEKEGGMISIKESLHVQFSPAGNYQMRYVDGSADILIRSPRRGVKKHKQVVARRKERFISWLEERLCEESGEAGMLRNWLSEGSKMVPVRHRMFPYLTYNRYVTNNAKSAAS